jgi:hypothetical protein
MGTLRGRAEGFATRPCGQKDVNLVHNPHRYCPIACSSSEVNMKRMFVSVPLLTLAICILFVDHTVTSAQEGWPPPQPGCHYIGNTSCGDPIRACAPHQRYFTQQCDDGRVLHGVGVDTYCASTSKGRFFIGGGGWKSNGYTINQTGDTFSITGGGAGPANGSFTGANTIIVTWPQVHATFHATVNGPINHANYILFDHPGSTNIWTRP